MNTRSTFKRNAANCAKEFKVSFELPKARELGVRSKGAIVSCERDLEIGDKDEAEGERRGVAEGSRDEKSSLVASSLVNDWFSCIGASRSGRK